MFGRLRNFTRTRIAEWVKRRQGSDQLPVTLHRRRIYILPTRAGAGFALMLLVMLIAGLNYANSLALFLTFLLAGFALVTMHQCHRNLLGTSLVGVTGTPGFAGGSGGVHIVLTGAGKTPRYQIEGAVLEEPAVAGNLEADERRTLAI